MQDGILQALHISFVLFWFHAFPQLLHLLVRPWYGRCAPTFFIIEARLDGLPVELRRFTVDPLSHKTMCLLRPGSYLYAQHLKSVGTHTLPSPSLQASRKNKWNKLTTFILNSLINPSLILANVTLIQPSKTLASLWCVPTFLLHRMEIEANSAKHDHAIAKINEAKRTEHVRL